MADQVFALHTGCRLRHTRRPTHCHPLLRRLCSLLVALIATSCCSNSSAQQASAAPGDGCHGDACPATAWRTHYSRPPLPLDPHLPHPSAFPFELPEPFGSVKLHEADCCPIGALPLPLPPLPRRPRMVFLLGVDKCGSTTLYQLLTLHPQIASWRRRHLHQVGNHGKLYKLFKDKESLFFSQTPQLTHADVDEYLRGWDHAHPDALWLDGTPRNLHLPTVACRIRAAFPDARLIITLREPLLRTVSSHQHELRAAWNRHLNLTSFEDRVQRELRLLARRGCAFPLQQPRSADAMAGSGTTTPFSAAAKNAVPEKDQAQLRSARSKHTRGRTLAAADGLSSTALGTPNDTGAASLMTRRQAGATASARFNVAASAQHAATVGAAAPARGEASLSGVKASWNDCFKCYYLDMCHPMSRLYDNSVMRQHCAKERRREDFNWFVMRAMYAPMIANWLRFFPSDQLYVVNMQDQVLQLPEIFKFLGLLPIKLESAGAALELVRRHSGESFGMSVCSGLVKLAGPAMQRLDGVYREQNRVLYQLINMMGLNFSRFSNPCNATGGGSEMLMR